MTHKIRCLLSQITGKVHRVHDLYGTDYCRNIVAKNVIENTTCPTSTLSPGRELLAHVVCYCIWNVLFIPRAALWMRLWVISPFRWSVKDTKCK